MSTPASYCLSSSWPSTEPTIAVRILEKAADVAEWANGNCSHNYCQPFPHTASPHHGHVPSLPLQSISWRRQLMLLSEPMVTVPTVHPQNVRFQNVRFQNVRFQNVRFQNVWCTKRQVYKTSGFKTSGFKTSSFLIWFTYETKSIGIAKFFFCIPI